MKNYWLGVLLIFIGFSCTRKYEKPLVPKEPTEKVSENFDIKHFNKVSFVPGNTPSVYSLKIEDSRDINHFIALDSVNLSSLLPLIPADFNEDSYLKDLFLNTQLENPYFINFTKGYKGLRFKGSEFESQNISVIQLKKSANNYQKWVLTLFTNTNGEELPYYVAEFEFPKPVFESVFKENNLAASSEFSVLSPDFNGLESKKMALNNLVKTDSVRYLRFENLNKRNYPGVLSEARGKVKSPNNFAFISELLTDSTFIATGPNNQLKKCQFARFQELRDVKYRQNEVSSSFELTFSDFDSLRVTRLVIGNFEDSELQLPLKVAEVWPLGIGLRPLVHSYHSMTKPFKFGVFVDESDHYLSANAIGVGAFQLAKLSPNKVNLLLFGPNKLTIIGNYRITIPR